MAITENQVNDIFKTQLGRPATPYEVKTYSNSSIQDLANLKSTYGSLNKDTSITDYLKYTGVDPETRNTLAQQYGVSNIGTAEGNTALLKALQSKTPPPTPEAPPIPGTVAPVAKTPQEIQAERDASQPTIETPTPVATPTDTTQPPKVPGIDDALNTYQSVQKQIADIDNSLNTMLTDKKAEIARSGGIVNESQLRSEILSEQAPLINQRKSLVAQQANAGKMYQDLLSQQKESDANFYKQQTLSLGQEKVDVQQQQFATKIEQAGWKSTKVNITDSAGNVLGQKIVWTQNPANAGDTSVSNSTQYAPTSSGSGSISKDGVTTVGNTQSYPKVTIADGASPEQVLQSLISGPVVPVKGSTTPLTQQTLYNLAIADMLGTTSTVGGRTPSGAIIAVKNKETDIMNAYGLTAFDISTAKLEVKGMTAANTALLGTAAFTKTYAATANDNLQLALEQSDKVPRSGAKIQNNYSQWLQGNFTPAGDLAEFETYIYTASREYAKVTSGGAKSAQGLTDSAQREVEKLINASQSPEVFKKVVTAMQNDMNNVIKNFDKQTSSFPDSVKALYGMAGGGQTQPTDLKSQITSKGYDYDAIKKEYPNMTDQQILDNL